MNKLLKLKVLTFAASLLVGISSCQHPRDSDRLSVSKGEITVAVDESFRPVAEAQIQAYQAHYPETKFNIIFTPEQKAINYLLSDSVELAIVSRELTDDEQQYYIQREREYHPATMALDAVVLITNKESDLESLSMEQIASILKGEDSKLKFIFDNSSSSNLNLMLNKFDIKDVNKANIYAANGTLDVFDRVENNKNIVGLIGLNWISDVDDKQSMKLKNQIKVLGIKTTSDSESILPSVNTLKENQYPFIKIIYLHTTQNGWGVAMGFIRFACTQIGQLVVEKMGLQPYYLIPKNYQLTSGKPIVVVE